MGSILVFYTTVDKEEDAHKLAKDLVEKKLAACVSIVKNVHSKYFWRGKIEESKEYLLIIKTHATKESDLVKYLKENHPYEVPEIIKIEAEAIGPYFNWLFDYLK